MIESVPSFTLFFLVERFMTLASRIGYRTAVAGITSLALLAPISAPVVSAETSESVEQVITNIHGSEMSSEARSKFVYDGKAVEDPEKMQKIFDAGVVLLPVSLALAIGSQAQIPALKELNTNVQKQLGIFNPELAAKAENAIGIAGGLVGAAGLISSLGLLIYPFFDKEAVTAAVQKMGEKAVSVGEERRETRNTATEEEQSTVSPNAGNEVPSRYVVLDVDVESGQKVQFYKDGVKFGYARGPEEENFVGTRTVSVKPSVKFPEDVVFTYEILDKDGQVVGERKVVPSTIATTNEPGEEVGDNAPTEIDTDETLVVPDNGAVELDKEQL